MNNQYENIISEVRAKSAQLVAVSKTKPVAAIENLYKRGQRIFGENRVHEMKEKYETLPKDINWHMIGHLQKNKVKYIAHFVDLIHSVDHKGLLEKINLEAQKHGRVIKVLLQLKIAEEETKYGMQMEDAMSISEDLFLKKYTNVNCCGVMGMATFTDDKLQVRKEFQTLKFYFEKLKSTFYKDNPDFDLISMGMSGDYKIALEEGSNLLRIGSLLFGPRT